MSGVDEEQIREVFRSLDTDESGKLEMKELETALFLLGIDLTPEERHSTFNLDGDAESFTEEEFIAMIKDKSVDIDYMQRFLESLQEFDEDGSTVITRERLLEILTMRGSDPQDDGPAEECISDIPFDENGCIKLTELAEIIYPGKRRYEEGNTEEHSLAETI